MVPRLLSTAPNVLLLPVSASVCPAGTSSVPGPLMVPAPVQFNPPAALNVWADAIVKLPDM